VSDDGAAVPIPGHRDRERALRGALARLRGDHDVLPLLAAECQTPTDVDMTIVAGFDALAAMVRRRSKDPESYLLQWIALERQLADDLETGDEAR